MKTSVLEEIEQKLGSLSLADKFHLIGCLAFACAGIFDLRPSKEAEELDEGIRHESRHMKIENAIALLRKIINSL